MRTSRIAVLMAVLLAVLGAFLLPSVGDIEARPKKPIRCGDTACLPEEACCALCPGKGYCAPRAAKGEETEECPAPLPFCPEWHPGE
ncbi:MAG TPA: hypothetical protein VJV75_07665 [Candidatus Polarisedimenticolia bacterium]|nr:hypothetical protein [Candidatus Polarisedimenticolia bacterium]